MNQTMQWCIPAQESLFVGFKVHSTAYRMGIMLWYIRESGRVNAVLYKGGVNAGHVGKGLMT